MWVVSCVTFSSYSLLINSDPFEFFSSYQLLYQCDPLSPYLFILMVEDLGSFIKSWVRQGLIQHWNWSGIDTLYSHLHFVDDTMLMGIDRVNEAINYRRLLNI